MVVGAHEQLGRSEVSGFVEVLAEGNQFDDFSLMGWAKNIISELVMTESSGYWEMLGGQRFVF